MIKKQTPRIAISIGDFNGIGPEIILKTLSTSSGNLATPVIIAPARVIEFTHARISSDTKFHIVDQVSEIRDREINVLNINSDELEITPGILSAESGKVAMRSIEKSIQLCMDGNLHALVTAPISKEAVNLAGYSIPGHTEFLASQTNTNSVIMMLVSGNLRVALVTTHLPIKEVASAISGELIESKIEVLAKSLIRDFGIEHPKIAVFGLNPHAGDGGIIGREELDLIEPLIKKIQETSTNFSLHGPFPADGFFGQQLHEKHDAILAMYHDQGLAPFKLLSFGKGVNFTAGLPIIRTSPDHGTAFDIAGKGLANPSSFKEAFNLAVKLANKRIREN